MERLGGSILTVKSSLYFMEKLAKQVGSQEPPTIRQAINPPGTKRTLEQGRVNGLKFLSDCPTLVICLYYWLLFLTRSLLVGYKIRGQHEINSNPNRSRSHFSYYFWSSYKYLTSYQSEDSSLHEVVIYVPSIMSPIEPRMGIIF